jgi:hypothetical protein
LVSKNRVFSAMSHSDVYLSPGKPIDKPSSLAVVTVPPAMAALDWTGSEDPGNPHNWSLAKKSLHVAVPSFFCLSV